MLQRHAQGCVEPSRGLEDRKIPLSAPNGVQLAPTSPECVEGSFSEVRRHGVLGSCTSAFYLSTNFAFLVGNQCRRKLSIRNLCMQRRRIEVRSQRRARLRTLRLAHLSAGSYWFGCRWGKPEGRLSSLPNEMRTKLGLPDVGSTWFPFPEVA